jgi:DNA-binding NarL/FixJ family response regulator
MSQNKMLIIDDHELFRIGLRMMLINHPNFLSDKIQKFEIVEADSISQALQLELQAPQIILLDIQLHGLNGIDGINLLQQKFPDTKIIIISASERENDIEKAATFGAKGFINKSAKAGDIVKDINSVLRGGQCFPDFINVSSKSDHRLKLTARQSVVLALICEGKPNRQIATELGLAENTVRVHVSAILSALNVNSRGEAMMAARSLYSEGSNDDIKSAF